MADAVAYLAIYPDAMATDAGRARAREIATLASRRLGLAAAPLLSDIPSLEFSPASSDELRMALDDAVPGWQDERIVYLP